MDEELPTVLSLYPRIMMDPLDSAESDPQIPGRDAEPLAFVSASDEARFRLAAIVECSDDAIISKNLQGIINSWNVGAQRIFEYSEAEAIGKPITLIIPKELRSEEVDILRRLRAGERIEHFETQRVSKSGRRVHVSLSISPIKNATGQIIGASKIARDITRRVQMEAALRDSENRLRLAQSAAHIGSWEWNPLRNLSSLSPELLDIFGIAASDPEQSAIWSSRVFPEDMPRIQAAWA
jgi:PAS domain S-box-containing protein